MLPQSENGPVTIDAVMALLRDGAMRRFRIDIEADSTISGDESQEKQDRTEFLNATTQFITAWAPILMQQPQLVNMAGDLLLFGVRGFRVGRELEETIEDTMDKLEEAASQPPQPDPKMQAEQAKLEAIKVKSQAEIQKAQISAHTAQVDGQAKMAQTMLSHHTSMQQAQMDQQAAAMAPAQAPAQGAGGGDMSAIHSALQQQQAQIKQISDQSLANSQQIAKGMAALAEAVQRPKKVVRDESGQVIGVE